MKTAFGDLIVNLRGGIALCRFQKLGPESFRISTDQLVLLIAAGMVLSIVSGYFTNLPDPEFNVYAFTSESFSAALLLLSTYIIARFILRREIVTALSVLILSASCILIVIWSLIDVVIADQIAAAAGYWWAWGAYLIWLLAVIFWCIRTINGSISLRVLTASFTAVFTWILPVMYFSATSSWWYASYTEQEDDSFAAYRDLNAERILFSQSDLLYGELETLEPGRLGITDVYFVGICAYATQDVFLKETTYARNLFDRRFDAEGRSINLINHLTTYADSPLASVTNLEETLKYIGSVMNKDEDILVLYMTSHGSSDFEISMSFWPLPLNDITPAMLREYLDESGIKWRVLMISACYAGGFIEPLRNEYSAIATAAAPDRRSFGCSNENDFTYFGEALLKNQLQHEYSLPVAFSQASEEISARETREKLTPSNPQFVVGDAIAPVLEALSIDLQAHAQASAQCEGEQKSLPHYSAGAQRDTQSSTIQTSRCRQ
jgi:hypothetical protein